MSEEPSPHQEEDEQSSRAADVEAIRSAESFEALKKSVTHAYESPSAPWHTPQPEHYDAVRNATKDLAGEVQRIKEQEPKEIDAILEQCLVDLPYVGQKYNNDEGEEIILEDLGASVARRVGDVFAKDAVSDEQIEIGIKILEEVAYDDEAAAPWGALLQLPKERLHEGVAERLLLQGARSNIVKDQSKDPHKYYSEFINVLEHAVGDTYGEAYYWFHHGKSTLEEPFRELIEDSRFLPFCIEKVRKDAQELQAHPEVQQNQLRNFEAYMIEYMIGLPENIAQEFRSAFADRSRIKSEDGRTLPLENGGGVNLKFWEASLKEYSKNIQKIGVENAVRLRKELGFINFDRFAPDQLKRMVQVLDADEKLIDKAQKHEVTIVATDALGDHNNAFTLLPFSIEKAAATDDSGNSTGDLVLFCEINQLSDIYRNLIVINKRSGIQASNLVVSAHGIAEGPSFGNDEKGKSRVTNQMLRDSAVGRFLEKYMKPGKESGKRKVLLNSCSLMRKRNIEEYTVKKPLSKEGEVDQAWQELYQESFEPFGYALADQAETEANVIVYGYDQSAGTALNKGKLSPYSTQNKSIPLRMVGKNRKGALAPFSVTGMPFNQTRRREK